MKGFRSIAFFTFVGLLGLITALETVDVKAIMLPLVCHVDASTVPVDGADDCTTKVIKYAGLWTAGIGAVGLFLRSITTSSIFKSLTGDE